MLSFFPRGVLDEILNLIESVSEGFPSYSYEAVPENNQNVKVEVSFIMTSGRVMQTLKAWSVCFSLMAPFSRHLKRVDWTFRTCTLAAM